MNRSNVGNVTTNGMQILSVGAVTGSKVFSLGKANATLNNKNTETEQARLENMQARTRNTNLKSDKLEKSLKETEKTVDDYMADVQSIYVNNSEQISDIQTKLSNDSDFLTRWIKEYDEDILKSDLSNIIGNKDDKGEQ